MMLTETTNYGSTSESHVMRLLELFRLLAITPIRHWFV